jgi:peroxiredoxin
VEEPTLIDGGAVSDFSLEDLDGQTVSLSDYLHDNVVLLSFWAPCCESGKAKTVDAQALYEAYGEQGLMVLAVTVDEPGKRAEMRTFCKQRKVAFPVLIDAESSVMDQLNPRRRLPFTIIIDRKGVIAWTHEGYVPGDEKLIEAAVVKVLEADASG